MKHLKQAYFHYISHIYIFLSSTMPYWQLQPKWPQYNWTFSNNNPNDLSTIDLLATTTQMTSVQFCK